MNFSAGATHNNWSDVRRNTLVQSILPVNETANKEKLQYCHKQAHHIFKSAAHLFWKHLSLLWHDVKHQNQSEPSIDPAAPVWEIVSGLLKWYQCSGDGWKLQEESVELNCWQPESQYISRSSKWLLFLLDIPSVGSWIVNTHCTTLSQLQFFLPLCKQENRGPPPLTPQRG